ncbi:MAG: hypothetical protein GX940_02660 [Clostridiaceae bacterium]|nr:hypothetical protein [Clostridiaceae bacterium]
MWYNKANTVRRRMRLDLYIRVVEPWQSYMTDTVADLDKYPDSFRR